MLRRQSGVSLTINYEIWSNLSRNLTTSHCVHPADSSVMKKTTLSLLMDFGFLILLQDYCQNSNRFAVSQHGLYVEQNAHLPSPPDRRGIGEPSADQKIGVVQSAKPRRYTRRTEDPLARCAAQTHRTADPASHASTATSTVSMTAT